MLEVKNIYKTFNPGTVNEKHALNGVSLKLKEGDFVTVIGLFWCNLRILWWKNRFINTEIYRDLDFYSNFVFDYYFI